MSNLYEPEKASSELIYNKPGESMLISPPKKKKRKERRVGQKHHLAIELVVQLIQCIIRPHMIQVKSTQLTVIVPKPRLPQGNRMKLQEQARYLLFRCRGPRLSTPTFYQNFGLLVYIWCHGEHQSRRTRKREDGEDTHCSTHAGTEQNQIMD